MYLNENLEDMVNEAYTLEKFSVAYELEIHPV